MYTKNAERLSSVFLLEFYDKIRNRESREIIMFDYKIKLFIDTVEQGSFSGAAKLNYISQSAVSQAVSKLEIEINTKLFNRNGYRPVLTKAGKYYYNELTKLCEEYQEIVQNTIELSDVQRKIVIGISNNYEKKHILKIVSEFKKEHHVKIEIKHHNPIDGVEKLKKRAVDIDFGILESYKGEAKICSIPVHTLMPVVVMSQDHPLANEKELFVKQIMNEPVVILNEVINKKTYNHFMNAFKLDGYVPKIVKECGNLEDFFMSVRFNEGIGYTVQELVNDEEGIVSVPLRDTHHESIIAIAYDMDNKDELLKELVNEIECYFKSL